MSRISDEVDARRRQGPRPCDRYIGGEEPMVGDTVERVDHGNPLMFIGQRDEVIAVNNRGDSLALSKHPTVGDDYFHTRWYKLIRRAIFELASLDTEGVFHIAPPKQEELGVEAILKILTCNDYFLRLDHFNLDDLEPGSLRWSLFRVVNVIDCDPVIERVAVFVYADYPNMVNAAYQAAKDDTFSRGRFLQQ